MRRDEIASSKLDQGTPTFHDASTNAFLTSVIGALVLSLRLLIASSWPDAAANALSCSVNCPLHALSGWVCRNSWCSPIETCMVMQKKQSMLE